MAPDLTMVEEIVTIKMVRPAADAGKPVPFQRLWWRDIASAPVPPREQLMYGRFECLLQDRKGNVVAGYAAYIKGRASAEVADRKHRAKPPEWRIQWYAGLNPLGNSMNRVFKPIYWMPIPKARLP